LYRNDFQGTSGVKNLNKVDNYCFHIVVKRGKLVS